MYSLEVGSHLGMEETRFAEVDLLNAHIKHASNEQG